MFTRSEIMTVQTIEIEGRELVVMSRNEFERLMEKAGTLPALPPVDAKGNRDALAFADAAIARGFITRRIKAGLTQKELAKRSGVRMETISRLESGKHIPRQETIVRLDDALKAMERGVRRRKVA
jgi:DNA-binding XRE family transcriptional regulator